MAKQPYINPTYTQPSAHEADIPPPGAYTLVRPLHLVESNGEMKLNPELVHHPVDTPDGPGYLTGGIREQDVTFIAPERKEQLRYKVGVTLVQGGVERFYLPAAVWEIQPKEAQPGVER